MKKARVLGLATVLALACTAVIGVASASAGGFTSGVYPSFPFGEQTGEFTLNTSMANQKCKSQTLTGQLNNPSATATFQPSNASCNLGTMAMNGCTFTFHPGSQGTGAGTFDIGPVGCGPIKVPDFNCTMSIPAQSGLTASYANVGSGNEAAVKITSSASLQYSYVGSKACEEVAHGPATFSGTWQVSGFTSAAHTTRVAFSVAATLPVGLYLGTSTGQAKLEAESYPVTVNGSQTASLLTFKGASGNAKCKKAQLTGEAAAAASEVSLGAEFSECTAFGQAATVAMNSCRFVVKVSSSGPPYAGSLALACSKEGDGIKIDVPSGKCSETFSPQTLGALSFENAGTGSGRHVIANVSGEGLAYTIAGSKPVGSPTTCGTVGSYADGKLTGGVDLVGARAF